MCCISPTHGGKTQSRGKTKFFSFGECFFSNVIVSVVEPTCSFSSFVLACVLSKLFAYISVLCEQMCFFRQSVLSNGGAVRLFPPFSLLLLDLVSL